MATPRTHVGSIRGDSDPPAGAAALSRADVAAAVGAVAAERDQALFVGNGFLLRETARLADGPHVFYLFGGMGLASSTACGYCRATGRTALVLEGDGNFLMGLGGAVCAPAVGVPLVHVVVFNGRYESSGDQPTALRSPKQLAETATALGYQHAEVVSSVKRLEDSLRSAVEGASLICAYAPGTAPSPPRPEIGPEECARRFRTWQEGHS